MRAYSEETNKIPFERHSLQCTLHSPEFKTLLHTKLGGIDNQKKFLEKIPSRWYYVQTFGANVLFYCSHHVYSDAESLQVLANELHHLCRKLHENKGVTYEEATEDLARISLCEEAVRKYLETYANKQEALLNYFNRTFENPNPKKLAPFGRLRMNQRPESQYYFNDRILVLLRNIFMPIT